MFVRTLLSAAVAVFMAAVSFAGGGDTPWKIGTPVVTYWAGPSLTDAVAQQMAAGGWNLVWCGEKELDVAQRHGLKVQLQDGLLAPGTLENPGQRAKLDALITRVHNHPALYAYFITDEPSAAAFPALGKSGRLPPRADPAHLAYINLFPTYANNEQLGTKGDKITAYREHLRQYMDVVKPSLVSYDHYQFSKQGDTPDYFLNLMMIRRVALEARVPFLNIVQACTWTPSMRVPGPDELRYLVYTTLAYGGQGISYYVYCHPGHTGGIALADGTPTPLYHARSRSIGSSSRLPKSFSPCVRWRFTMRACHHQAPTRCRRRHRSNSTRLLLPLRILHQNVFADSCSAASARMASRPVMWWPSTWTTKPRRPSF